MIESVKVGELVIDHNISPRAGMDFTHVGVLKNALLAGVAFPPIVAERSTRRIVDGHRYKAYTQLWGEWHEIEVDFRDYADETELFLAAVEANNAHGLRYSTNDRRRILVEAEKRGISRDLISSALKMPVEKADKKIADGSAFVKTPGGKRERVPLRTGMKKLAGRDLSKKQEEANKKRGMKAEYHCDALIPLLRPGLLTWGSKNVLAICGSLHKELDKRLERLAS
jgi:hypothetical protein